MPAKIANATKGAPVNSVSNETQSMSSEILDVIAAEGMVPREKLQDDATIESLGLKSIDIVMILTAIEEKFDVYIPMDGSFQEAKDLKGLVDAIAVHIQREKSGK
jgi:acyl carrier protein